MLQGRPPYNDKDYVPNEDRAYIPRGYPKFYDEDWVGLDGEAQVWLSELRRHLTPQTSNLKPDSFLTLVTLDTYDTCVTFLTPDTTPFTGTLTHALTGTHWRRI